MKFTTFVHYPHTATEYDFYTDEYATTPYTEEFTEEDEREYSMNNPTVQLERQNENNKRYAGGATFVVTGSSQFGATISVNPGSLRAGATVDVTIDELAQIADRIDKILGRAPRKVEPAVSVKVEGDQLIVTGLFDVVAPF